MTKRSRLLLVTALAMGALVTLGFLVLPWVFAAVRGDIWVDTLGYQVTADSRDPALPEKLTFDFYGSESGGAGTIRLDALSDGDRVLLENPGLKMSPKSDFHLGENRNLDLIRGELSLRALRPVPDLLTVRGVVTYRRAGEARLGAAPFTLTVETEPRRRNTVFHRTKLRFGE